MQPIIMYGEPVKNKMFENWKPDKTACLTILSNGEDEAGKVYVRNKIEECNKRGIKARKFDISLLNKKEVMVLIRNVINDTGEFGSLQKNYIILQKPIPNHLKPYEYLFDNEIETHKECDIDAFCGDLSNDFYTPATPLGIMKMLDYYIGLKNLDGMDAVVIGRSKIVGKPMADLLTKANCTVTTCHSHTENLPWYTKHAKLIISAIGKPKFITSWYIGDNRPIVIDVGINRDENFKLCGDVDFDSVKDKCSYISPVPKGVGVLTVASLIYKMGNKI